MFLLKASFALLQNLFTENLRTFEKKEESPNDWKEGLLNNLLRKGDPKVCSNQRWLRF